MLVMNRMSSARKVTNQDDLNIQESSTHGDKADPVYEHRWWRIFLILFTMAILIVACILNALSGSNPAGVFIQRTGEVSDANLTELTPANWTFSIWAIIYFWQLAWMAYAISRIPRKSNQGYLYMQPNTLHFGVILIYAINMALNITWLFLFDRQFFGWALLVLFGMFLTAVLPFIITHVLLQRNRPFYVRSKRTTDIWLVRLFVHNGLAVYGTWLYLATILNLTIWVSQIYNRNNQSIIDASTAGLSLILVGVVVYFILDVFIFYSSLAYTFLTWFVFIYAFAGVTSRSFQRTETSERNKSFGLALLIIASAFTAIRLIIFIIRYIKGMIPTISNP